MGQADKKTGSAYDVEEKRIMRGREGGEERKRKEGKEGYRWRKSHIRQAEVNEARKCGLKAPGEDLWYRCTVARN